MTCYIRRIPPSSPPPSQKFRKIIRARGILVKILLKIPNFFNKFLAKEFICGQNVNLWLNFRCIYTYNKLVSNSESINIVDIFKGKNNI